ncbi:MAG: glycoside hydrolase family 3 C-terminal domain-containing protein [Bacteroides sp.]|nr:glycoside hydrolase family 3 C-terminal domain-containing protein [Bacteroides sp.]
MKTKHITLLALLTWGLGTANAQELKLSEENIDEIVRALTLEEKAKLLVGRNDYTFGGYDNPDEFVRFIAPSVSGYTQGIPRLGIPPTALADGPAGAVVVTRSDNKKHYTATGFPVGTALACSWNVELVEEVGRAMGNEILEYGIDVILAPGMNIQRSPLCGRNYEYYSEDPYVTGKIAAAYVRGVQSNGVGTSLKHYAANSQETNRTEVDEIVSQRALREIYLKPFEIAVKEAQPWTVMASYNRLNGPYTQESYELLTTVLRDEWGFEGIVLTDWIGRRNTAAQLKAGIDNLQPGYQVQLKDIDEMVKDGRLSMEDIDRAVKRVLQYIVKTPHFRNYKYSDEPDLKAHAAITRTSATEGMVLLKNEGDALPLKDVKKVALFGCHSYDFLAGGTGSGHVVKPYVVDLQQGLNNAGLEIDKNMQQMYNKYKEFWHAKNRADRDPEERYYTAPPIQELAISRTCIKQQAAHADVAIVTLGRQAGEGGDRTIKEGFNLSRVEQELLSDVCEAFHAQDKKVIVVLNIGGAIETASWKGLPDAILLAWQPGQEGGNSVADVLLGKENPSGKLTMTFPIAAMDMPSSRNFPVDGQEGSGRRWGERKNIDYTLHAEGINIGYRYFSTEERSVSYPFGFGLSYTTFAYSKPRVKAVADGFEASITVTKTGKVAGKESVQLYVTAPDGAVEKPALELKTFAKTRKLQPGESETLTMKVPVYDLASFNETIQSWVSDKGTYTIQFGASVEDIRTTATYRLAKEQSWKVNDVLKPTRELK